MRSYDCWVRRQRLLLEAAYGLVILAALAGVAFTVQAVLHPAFGLEMGLDTLGCVAVFVTVERYSSMRAIRHQQQLEEAYERGRLVARSEQTASHTH